MSTNSRRSLVASRHQEFRVLNDGERGVLDFIFVIVIIVDAMR